MTNIVALLKGIVDEASNENLNLTEQQLRLINRATFGIKSIASNSSIKFIDETKNQIDKIDSFINSLEDSFILDDKLDYYEKNDNFIQIQINSLNTLIQNIVALNNQLN
jgi:hypothetical protein